MDFQVRPIAVDDIPAYMDLRQEMLLDSPWAFGASPGDDMPEALLRERLAGPENVIVGGFVEDAGSARIVASAGVYRTDQLKARHLAHIWGVYTSPAARAHGIGRAVVSGAIGVARGWDGVAGVCLSVSDREVPARCLYESLGFEAWGIEPDAIRIDGEPAAEVYMRLRLSSGTEHA